MSLQAKKTFRHDMNIVLGNLDPRWVSAGSHRVGINLLKLLEKLSIPLNLTQVLGYTSFFPGEIDLSYFFSLVGRQTKLFLPTVHEEEKQMTFFDVGALWQENLLTAHYSIPEDFHHLDPFQSEQANNTLVLVPGLAFDRKGNRIGRGKGFYDRFLDEHPEILTIGVCWDLQIVDQVPTEPHDAQLKWLCTESEIIRC